MKSKLLVILLTAVMISITAAGCGINNNTADTDGFPNLNSFTAVTLDGKAFNEQDLSGADLTMINIWSTTCGPCLREMPELAELEKSLPDNVNLITFCFDASANPESVREVLSEAGFEGITLTEGDGDLESLLLSIQYVPTSVFVDSNGNQVGQAIIGAPNDPVEYYTQAINDALDSLGKDQI